jgi:methylenetetrahydrofolate dehydrogenase (NADP+)/methenyltetrahydrofolate cyclohydrolase
MLVPTTKIRSSIETQLRTKAQKLHKAGVTPKLLAIVLEETPAQKSYIAIKRQLAERLGIEFSYWLLDNAHNDDALITKLQERLVVERPSGVIIQQPLPQGFSNEKIYRAIPSSLEIEGHLAGAPYTFPLVQAALLGLGYVFAHMHTRTHKISLPVSLTEDELAWLRQQRIVIAGNGVTTGRQIARYFDDRRIPFVQTNSQTKDNDHLYRMADIIISGVGKSILHPDNLKKGVILLNFGLHRNQQGILVGDYDEEAIRSVASYYTQTPGGLGPIDVLCMYGNLLQATDTSPSIAP